MDLENVLVVDDEEAIREVVSTMLESKGYRCTAVSNGRAAQEHVKRTTPDLVLSDMIMPEMDGIKLLEWLRQYDPEIPVIMVTAIHDISTALEAIRRGAYDYILKPFEKDQLFLGVGRALQHRRLVMENRAYQRSLEEKVEERTAQLTGALAQLEQSYDDTLEALGSALDLKDAETEGHCQRVTAFCISIAKAMPVPNGYLPVLARAAFLHDISVALAAIRNGAYDYLLKPFEREQLLNTVSRALENRRLKVENRTYQTNLESLVKARTDQLQAAIQNLERSYDITLEALGDALDLKDAETEGHSKRVTAFTIAIAKNMGLPREQIAVIARGAFLHDFGKMAIPDAILRKPGKLTKDEMDIMQEHAYLGYQMLKKIPFLAEASEIVYTHQEKFDGSGYPRRLKGEQIPLGARIFSVADTLDAITSDRPYRPAQSLSAAREEIKKWSGRQFDPEVVRVFLEMPDSIWEGLRKDIDGQSSRAAFSTGAKG